MEPDKQFIADRYRLIRRIDSGGMADVFLAHDTRLDRQVAVKVLYRSFGADATAVERFKREARAAASLDHPGIVSIYDWGETDEAPFIVMAYIPGDSLKEVLRRRGQLPQTEVLGIARQVTAALVAAHAHGIVHRDIKPHNILLRPDGQVCITDFGIARILDQTAVTTGNVVIGSALYLSPEQAQGQEVDARSDLYSLGVVMFELLTGRTPFSGESLPSLALQHVTRTPPAPSDIHPAIVPVVDDVVLKALVKDPAQRYQSATEMGADIETALTRLESDPDQGIVTPAPRPWPTPADLAATAPIAGSVTGTRWVTHNLGRPPRRWPLTLGLAGLLLTGLLGVLVRETAHWSGFPPSHGGGIVATVTAAPSPTRTTTPAATAGATEDPARSVQPLTTPSPTRTPAPTSVSLTPTATAAPETTPPVVTPTTPPAATSTPAPTPTLPPPSPTPTSTAPATPTPAPTPTPTAPPSPTPSSTAPPATPTPTPTSAPGPSATPSG